MNFQYQSPSKFDAKSIRFRICYSELFLSDEILKFFFIKGFDYVSARRTILDFVASVELQKDLVKNQFF